MTAVLDVVLRRHEANREAIEALNHFHDEQVCFSDEYWLS